MSLFHAALTRAGIVGSVSAPVTTVCGFMNSRTASGPGLWRRTHRGGAASGQPQDRGERRALRLRANGVLPVVFLDVERLAHGLSDRRPHRLRVRMIVQP